MTVYRKTEVIKNKPHKRASLTYLLSTTADGEAD